MKIFNNRLIKRIEENFETENINDIEEKEILNLLLDDYGIKEKEILLKQWKAMNCDELEIFEILCKEFQPDALFEIPEGWTIAPVSGPFDPRVYKMIDNKKSFFNGDFRYAPLVKKQ